jgi:hypothetical protein
MPTLLKQFSLDDAPAEAPRKKEKPDYLRRKYISGEVTPDHVMTKSHKPEKRKVVHRPNTDSDKKTNPRLVRSLLSENFSPKAYLWQIPTLILGLLSYYLSMIILQKIQPVAIKDVILPNSYLPLVLTLGFGHFFTGWYLSQNIRRSSELALLLTLLLALRIHHFWNLSVVLLLILLLLGTEFLLTYRTHRR